MTDNESPPLTVKGRMWSGDLADVLACIRCQQMNNTYRGSSVGRMLRDYNGLKVGHYVLVHDVKGKECVIERAMPPEEIERQVSQHSLLTTILPVIGFPSDGVEVVMSADQIGPLPTPPPVPPPGQQGSELPTDGKVHELKTWPKYFAALVDGSKTFELRRNDRGFQVGDKLRLREWDYNSGYSGRELSYRVTYIAEDTNWLQGGCVAMGIEPISTPAGQQGSELPQMVHGPCQLTNGREWVVFQSAGAMIPPPGCQWNVPEGFSAVRISPPAAASEGERIADLKAAIARIKSKFPWHRGDVGSPDVPVLQERYDALRAALAASESDRREAEAEVCGLREWLADVRLATLGALPPSLAEKIDAQLEKSPPMLLAALSDAQQSAAAMREALASILVPTNFISLEAARDYVSEVLGVGRYAERGPNHGAAAVYSTSASQPENRE